MSDKPHWSNDWDQTESDEDYADRHYRHWLERQNWTNGAFQVTAEELARIYERCVERFNAHCDRLERQEDDAKIRHLLTEALGAGTYMVEESNGRH